MNLKHIPFYKPVFCPMPIPYHPIFKLSVSCIFIPRFSTIVELRQQFNFDENLFEVI